jgi:hypothetical protein
MTVVNYIQVINDSRAELKQQLAQREITDKRIAQLIIALRALARFLPETQREEVLREIANAPRRPATISDAISNTLRAVNAANGLTSQQIRERLEESGFDLSEYSQPLGTIFATLKRLIKKGCVKRIDGKDETILFKWSGPHTLSDLK